MNRYLFLLGKSTSLCSAEIDWVCSLKNKDGQYLSDSIKSILLNEDEVEGFANMLGGIVKVAQVLPDAKVTPQDQITQDLIANDGKVNFCVFGSDEKNIQTEIKNKLKEIGKPSRFIETNNIYDTAISLGKNYSEYWILPENQGQIVAKVVWAQDIRLWTKKDLDRPRSDPKSGMLPPKIARILVNLASTSLEKKVVYDPFCGSGTILMEAMSLGNDVVGSDINTKAVEDSQANLAWYKNTFNSSNTYRLFQEDATHTSPAQTNGLVDAIVFEPYMGPPQPKVDKIKDIAKGLEKLYIGTLKNLNALLPKGKRLVCILPTLKAGNVVKRTDGLIDRCENFGYTLQAGPLEYSRPFASVVRQIYVLEKN